MEEKKYNDKLWDILNEFSDNTNVMRYLNSLKNVNNEESKILFQRKYLPIIKKEKKERTPFLSVIIRTQGKREDGLRESLLCLQAQSNQDFEIILIAHKPTDENEAIVRQILEEQSDIFRDKIRYYRLDEGTRTTPLNFGFAHAWGKYAAIYDDDDILFDNWIESFWKCAQENEGRILHSFAFAQEWEYVEHRGFRAISSPQPNYCVPYDVLTQLSVNKCPLMTLAFPLNYFQNLGYIFDEQLNVMEDWEYFMRVAFICGVSDEQQPTAIYRFWKNIESSATLHNQDDWNETYHAIRNSFDRHNVIIPQNYLSTILNRIESNHQNYLQDTTSTMTSMLFYSEGEPFDVQRTIKAVNQNIYPEFDLWFLLEQKTRDITALRFDLTEEGMFVLNEINITMWFTNGEKREVSLDECIHNGIEKKDAILFINEDPVIVWEWKDERMLDVVHISGKITRSIPRFPIIYYIVNIFPIKRIIKKRKMHKKGYF